MKLYHSLVPLLVIAQDDDPLADWEIRDLSLQCGFDTPTELSFEVYPGDIDIDTSTFHARDCSYGDLTEVITEAVTENLPADQQDKGRTKYTVKYNPNTCMSTVADPANLGTYASNVTFNFDFGYEHQSVFMHMRTYRIPAICSFQSQYNLKFDFGKIEQGIVETNGTDLQPINGGIVFDFNVYKDSALTEPVYNTNSGLKTGQMVYFTIVPQFHFPSGLQYAPPVCKFLQETCDEDDNCNIHQEFSLFDHEVDECQQPPNSPLHFDLSYIQSTDEWRSQFRLFLFGEDIDQSSYTLRCEVDVCVDTCASDVVVPNQQCSNIAQKCLSEDEYIQFDDQCLFCPPGQQANEANDACVPIIQFSSSAVATLDEVPYPNPIDSAQDGDFLIACGNAGYVRGYNMTTKSVIRTYGSGMNEMHSCDVNSKYVFGSGVLVSKVKVWHRHTGAEKLTLQVDWPLCLTASETHLFVFAQDTKGIRFIRLADIENRSGTVNIDSLDYVTVNVLGTTGAHGESAVRGMTLDEEFLYSVDQSHKARKWRISTGELVSNFGNADIGHKYPIVYGDYLIALQRRKICVVDNIANTILHCFASSPQDADVMALNSGIAYTIKRPGQTNGYVISYNIDKVIAGERDLSEILEEELTNLSYPYHAWASRTMNFWENTLWLAGGYGGIKVYEF